MRIAVDLTHPAHFHFFKNAIGEWRAAGDDVLILSRDKDLTQQLLAESGWDHRCLSRARRGYAGLAGELLEHGGRVWKEIGRHRSEVVAAIGGTFMVHAARLRRVPSLVFYDTENATISNRITYPAATRIFTPRSYRHDLGSKQERYAGYQELAYLHPKRFRPDADKLAAHGLSPGQPFIFVRLVAWASHHDHGDFGVRDLEQVVAVLGRYGRVLISSEAALPPSLQPLAWNGAVSDVHHVMAFARMTFGESATMASEGAQLGVPGVFLSTSSRGYTDELESRYGLISNFNGANAVQEKALARAQEILGCDPQIFRERYERMIEEQIDVTEFIVNVVRRYARR